MFWDIHGLYIVTKLVYDVAKMAMLLLQCCDKVEQKLIKN